MHELSYQIVIPVFEGLLALGAAMAAVAFRRRTRALSPAGFIMLALGLMLDLMAPRPPHYPQWAPYLRAAAVMLLWFGVIRLGVESVEAWLRRRNAQISTIGTELVLTVLYAAVVLIVGWAMLVLGMRRLAAIPALFALVRTWMQRRDLFSGLLIQSQRPFRPGDWIRFGAHVGEVEGTGWRATRIRTRTNELVTIPSSVLASDVVVNYSSAAAVADEIFVALGYGVHPGTIAEVVQEVLGGIAGVGAKPMEVAPWEYGDRSIRYRIRYWLDSYEHQDAVREQVMRNLWFALRRKSIEIATPARAIAVAPPANDTGAAHGSESGLMEELRKVYLLKGLSDGDLRLMLPSIKVREFGRGEFLMRQGARGECFYILRRGTIDLLENSTDGGAPRFIKSYDQNSEQNFFGEIALLTGEPRTATLRAETDVEALEIDRKGFETLFKMRPAMAAAIADIAAAREEATRDRQARSEAQPNQTERRNRIWQAMVRTFDLAAGPPVAAARRLS